MVRNHLYFHSSNFDYIEFINGDPKFEPVYQYPRSEFEDTHVNEWGRIKTESNYYHFIIGNIPQKGCPWCGIEMVLKKLPDVNGMDYSSCCMRCPNCGAMGPVIQINSQVQIDEKYFEAVKDIIARRNAVRLPWDHESFGVLRNG